MLWRAAARITPGIRILGAVTERGARLEGERRLLQVSDVLRAIEDQFSTAFPRRIWVFGTLRGLRSGPPDAESGDERGVDSFVLVEDCEDGMRTLPCELLPDARVAIDDTLRRLHDVAVDDLLVDGHLVRAGGLLSYDPTRHCAIFEVTALDPQPTAAWLAERREQVRVAAASARLAERQRDLQVPIAPASIALVAASGDPALEASQQLLGDCGFEVDVEVYAPNVAGSAAGDQLANGLREAALAGHDIVLLLRQDGRPLSLAPFDSEAVVRAVATSTTPVLSGLGSPDEPAAVEEVAHQAYPTAHEATVSVVRRLQRARALVEDTVLEVVDARDEALRRAARRLEQTRHRLAEDIRQATTRTTQIRARRLRRIRLLAAVIAAAVIAAAVIAGAVVTQLWLILAALVIPLGIALAAPRMRTTRRKPVTVTQLNFSEALAQLADIGRQLREVSDPDDVVALEADADTLAEHCRALLRRPRKLHANPAPQPDPVFRPTVTADGGVIAPPNTEAPQDVVDVQNNEQPTQTVVLPVETMHSQQP